MKCHSFNNAFYKIFTKFRTYNSCNRNGSQSSYLAKQNVSLHSCCQQYVFSNQLCNSTFMKSNIASHLFYIKGNFLSSSSALNFIKSDVCKKKSGPFDNPYEEELQKKIRKETFSPQVFVLDLNNNVTKMTLDSANKFAQKRDLKLVKVDDPKRESIGNKPLYQLMTGKQLSEERLIARLKKKEMDHDAEIKGEKTLVIASKIGAADLDVKVNKLLSFLDKKYIVNMQIVFSSTGETKEAVEKVCAQIEKSIAGVGKVTEKQDFKRGIKLAMKPITEKKVEEKT